MQFYTSAYRRLWSGLQEGPLHSEDVHLSMVDSSPLGTLNIYTLGCALAACGRASKNVTTCDPVTDLCFSHRQMTLEMCGSY